MGGELTPAREGFDFLPGADPYSDGVVARPGHEIVHVAVAARPPWQVGFELVTRFLERRGRRGFAGRSLGPFLSLLDDRCPR